MLARAFELRPKVAVAHVEAMVAPSQLMRYHFAHQEFNPDPSELLEINYAYCNGR
jgi:hypothetical protein